ncbi:MAG: hypothetical protein ACE5IY_21365 [bacterium]
MATVRIWHNPRCSKSRLQQEKCDLEVFVYLKEPIDPKELARVIRMSG